MFSERYPLGKTFKVSLIQLENFGGAFSRAAISEEDALVILAQLR